MLTLSHVILCSEFSKETNPFATAFFTKSETGNSFFITNSMQSAQYTFGLVLRGIEGAINGFWDSSKSDDDRQKLLFDFLKSQPTDGINAYDITVLEVTDNKYKSITFDGNKLETFHRAYIGSRDECLADLKRQFEKNKNEWQMEAV